MTEFKIKISELREICELVSLEGKDLKGKSFRPIPDFIIDAGMDKPDILQVRAKNKGGQLALDLSFKLKETIAKPGQLVIGDTENFLGFLDRFNASDEVIVSTTENKIIMTRSNPKKVARIPMADQSTVETKDAQNFLDKYIKGPDGFYQTTKTKFDVRLSLKAEDIKNVIDDGEAVKQRIYPWHLDQSGLNIKVEGPEGEIETSIPWKTLETASPLDQSGGPMLRVDSAYAYGIDNIFGNLSGDVNINLANNIGACPIVIDKNTDKYTLKIILAPVVLT